MEGLLRALLFGGAACLALTAAGFALFPDFFDLSTTAAWTIAAGFALASAVTILTARRLPATPSWLIGIVGWIVGFNLVPLLTGPLLGFMASQSGR
jgi:uncharacterized membrane protein HdeD (DUF308 family)